MGLLRLLLALAVVSDHAGPALGWTPARMTGGPLAVQMFYIVSGFYMAMVLSEKYLGRGAYWAFAKSRVIRLYPMYLVVLAVTLGVGIAMHLCGWTIDPVARWIERGSDMPWLDAAALGAVQLTLVGQDAVVFTAVDPGTTQLVFAADFHDHELPSWQFMFVPQAWTVSLELMFYALAPLLVRRVAVLVPLLVASLGLRVLLVVGLGLDHDPWTYRFFPTELALFLAGAASYHGYRWLRGGKWLLRILAWPALIAVLAYVIGYRALPELARARIYGLSGILFALPCALPFVFHVSARWRWDRAVGELSYPVYLVHFLFCFGLAALGLPMWTPVSGAVVPALTLAVAWALWRYVGARVEVSRQRIGERLRAAQRPSTEAAS